MASGLRPVLGVLMVLAVSGCFGGGSDGDARSASDQPSGSVDPSDGLESPAGEAAPMVVAFAFDGTTGTETCMGAPACSTVSAQPGENGEVHVEEDLADGPALVTRIRFNVTWSAATEVTSRLVVKVGQGGALRIGLCAL